MRLSELKKGASAIILHINDEQLAVKLYEMGCLPGEKVTVENIAPLGDPLAITFSGYKLFIRQSDAGHVIIKPE